LKIAFFDSGIGGLTVLQDAIGQLPSNEFIYYADTKNVPYGTKPKNEVVKCVLEAVDFLSGLNIHVLVVACNAATSAAITELRNRYHFPIIGMEPAVKPAVLQNRGKDILVLATSLTLRESKLNSLITSIDKRQKVKKLAMDGLVKYAENFDFTSFDVRTYVKSKLNEIDLSRVESIVLGCTHFLYFKDLIQETVGNHIQMIDGNIGTINNLKSKMALLGNGESNEARITFYSSGVIDSEERQEKLLALLDRR